jgi:hypothetical protein
MMDQGDDFARLSFVTCSKNAMNQAAALLFALLWCKCRETTMQSGAM